MLSARVTAFLSLCTCCLAQDLEPRRWTHLPVDTNFLGVGYLYTEGELHFDPVLRIEDAEVELHTVALSLSRYFRLFGTTARIDVTVPVQRGEWDGLVDSVPTSVTRDGLGDPILRFSVNLTGAPALTGKEFMEYKQERAVNTALGAALEVRLPLGDYQEDKLINLGQNRLVAAPQIGVLHTRRQWSFELTGSTYFYAENDEFFDGNSLEQSPLFAAQTHVVRTFEAGYWLSVGAAYGWGGESTINGVEKDDERSNLLYGGSFGFRIGETQSVKLAYARGDALEDIGSDTDSVLLGWSIRF
jgi:hypothetical protein